MEAFEERIRGELARPFKAMDKHIGEAYD